MKVNTGIYIARLCVYRLALSFGVEARRGSEKGEAVVVVIPLALVSVAVGRNEGIPWSVSTAWPLLSICIHLTSCVQCCVMLGEMEGTVLPQHPNPSQ